MSLPKKILILFTGGTISSRLHNKTVELGTAPYSLLESFRSKTIDFDILEPISVLSENITPEMYRVLFTAVATAFSPKKHSGILIAHGTDTLAFTAQLAHLLLSGLPVPVVLFGSKLPPDDPRSEAPANLKAALILLSQIPRGVYVVGRTATRKTLVHHASLVQSADAITDDFSSSNNAYAGKIVRNTYLPNPASEAPPPFRDATAFLSALRRLTALPLTQTVLCIPAAAGTNYENYRVSSPAYSFILITPYHSGTANALSETNPFSLLYLKKACDDTGKRLFLGPRDSGKPLYSTTEALLSAGITPIPDMPFESAWAILLVCTWLGKDPDKYFEAPLI
jgi:L-asparaginase